MIFLPFLPRNLLYKLVVKMVLYPIFLFEKAGIVGTTRNEEEQYQPDENNLTQIPV